MPQYGINTALNEKQTRRLREATAKTKQSTYKFLRDACLSHIEEVLKEKKPDEREKNKRDAHGKNGQDGNIIEDID